MKSKPLSLAVPEAAFTRHVEGAIAITTHMPTGLIPPKEKRSGVTLKFVPLCAYGSRDVIAMDTRQLVDVVT